MPVRIADKKNDRRNALETDRADISLALRISLFMKFHETS